MYTVSADYIHPYIYVLQTVNNKRSKHIFKKMLDVIYLCKLPHD